MTPLNTAPCTLGQQYSLSNPQVDMLFNLAVISQNTGYHQYQHHLLPLLD